MRYIYSLFFLCCFYSAQADDFQQDSLIADSTINFRSNKFIFLDSAKKASIASKRDSITYAYLKPNPDRINLFTDSLLKAVLVSDRYLLTPAKSIKIKKNNYGFGNLINKTPIWFLLSSVALLVLFGIIKIIFKKEVDLIFYAFFDKRTLTQINKEDNVFVSWQFLFLYLIFTLTISLFICLTLYKTAASESSAEFSILLLVSLFSFIFFGLKILVLRLIGFVFKVQKLIRDYTNIIYLTYFNLLFILLPITFCLALINLEEQYYIFWAVTIFLLGIIVFQYLRITFNILLNYRLSKFYLIIYLCVLEICPIIIFVKSINNSL
jgi:hypothetical protein